MTPRRTERGRHVAAVCLTILGAAGAWTLAPRAQRALIEPRARAQQQAGPRGAHGALAMEQQREKVDALLPKAKAVAPPQGVAPTFFSTLVPKDNPGTAAQIALGKKLYFELRLSRDGTVACATCHDVSRGFTDRRPLFEGVGDSIGRRNSPTTMNALFFHTMFWDGRAMTLEDQAKLPIVNPIEMGQPTPEAAVKAIAGDTAYQTEFRAAYGRDVNYEDIARAIASFERTLVFIDAPFDRFLAGDAKALSEDAQAGWTLFNGKARCTGCHQLSGSSPIGSDNRFHNIGVSARHQNFEQLAQKALKALEADNSREAQDKLALESDLGELGRFVVTKNRSDIGAFKTEQLRNIGVTAPYMHDGSLTTLWDVMDHYNKGGEPNPYLDGGMEPLALSERELDQVVAFLFSLTDDRLREQNDSELKRQREIASSKRPFRDEALATRKVFLFERRLQTGR